MQRPPGSYSPVHTVVPYSLTGLHLHHLLQRRSCPLGYLPSQGSIRHLLCHEHRSSLLSHLAFTYVFMLCPTLLKRSTASLNFDENCMRRLSWSRHEKFHISFQYAFHQPLLPSSMQGGHLGSPLARKVERQRWNFHGSLSSR